MMIGRVAGTVVSTIHLPIVAGRRLLLVDLLDLEGQATGSYVIAVDTVDAGAGERVLVLDEGNGARQVLGEPEAPIRAVIVGVVDDIATAVGGGDSG
jgi:microcompartment protein CcmK/EutM